MTNAERPTGLSTWEAELYDELTSHVASEATLLDRYTNLAETSGGHVRFLLELIGEDEARHHRLYEQWADTIREAALMQEAADGVPALGAEHDPTDLLNALDELLAIEKADTHHLKQLQRDLKDVRKTTIWPLIVELMQLDTEKHIKILEFLRQHAKATTRDQTGRAARS